MQERLTAVKLRAAAKQCGVRERAADRCQMQSVHAYMPDVPTWKLDKQTNLKWINQQIAASSCKIYDVRGMTQPNISGEPLSEKYNNNACVHTLVRKRKPLFAWDRLTAKIAILSELQ